MNIFFLILVSRALAVQLVRNVDRINGLFYNTFGIPLLENTKRTVFTIGNWIAEDVQSMDSRLEQLNLDERAKKQVETLKTGLSRISDTLKSINDGLLNENVQMAGQVMNDFMRSAAEVVSSSMALIARGVKINQLFPRFSTALTNLGSSLMKDIQTFVSKLASSSGLSGLFNFTPSLPNLSGLYSLPSLPSLPSLSGLSNPTGLFGLMRAY